MIQQKSSLSNLSPAAALNSVTAGNRSQLTEPKSNLGLGRSRASNSSRASAKLLGAFPPGKKTVKDSVGQGGSTDFFQVEITEKSRVRFVLTNRSEEKISGKILDASGNLISANGKKQEITVAANESTDTLIRGAAPGTYYLKVKGPASSKNRYEINLFVNRSGGPAPLPCGCGT